MTPSPTFRFPRTIDAIRPIDGIEVKETRIPGAPGGLGDAGQEFCCRHGSQALPRAGMTQGEWSVHLSRFHKRVCHGHRQIKIAEALAIAFGVDEGLNIGMVDA
jgi:hypothetical protein